MYTPTVHTSHTVRFVIYWCNVKFTAMILGVCLVWLFLTIKYTFIHTIVLLLFFLLVTSSIYIIVKIAIDFFYSREIENPFRYRNAS